MRLPRVRFDDGRCVSSLKYRTAPPGWEKVPANLSRARRRTFFTKRSQLATATCSRDIPPPPPLPSHCSTGACRYDTIHGGGPNGGQLSSSAAFLLEPPRHCRYHVIFGVGCWIVMGWWICSSICSVLCSCSDGRRLGWWVVGRGGLIVGYWTNLPKQDLSLEVMGSTSYIPRETATWSLTLRAWIRFPTSIEYRYRAPKKVMAKMCGVPRQDLILRPLLAHPD